MRKIEYMDFELRIGKREGEGYPVSVIHSPAGEATEVFILPFTEEELAYIKMVIELAVLRSRERTRQAMSLELKEIESFGAKLFDSLFHGPIRSCYDGSLRVALGQGKGLRIKLRIEPPELFTLPWEFLYSRDERKFLILSTKTPLVRYRELLYPPEPLLVAYPLHILVMLSCPRDYPPLDVEGERRRIEEALDRLAALGVVEVDFLEEATLPSLQDRLRGGEYHTLHYIGHGSYDEEEDEGLLILEGAGGRGERVKGDYLGRLLGDHFSLRLVVLNACETGRASLTDPFSGVAASLVDAGIPAVVAMQFGITDEAAITFAREFYAALADSYPVDAAVAEGRKAIDYSIKNTVEWATPVLYMRAPDGVIFRVQPKSLVEVQEGRLRRLYEDGARALEGGDWGTAIELFGQVVAIEPHYKDASAKLAEAKEAMAREKRLAELYEEGMGAMAKGEWGRAVSLFREVVSINASYQHAAANLAEAMRRERAPSLSLGSLWPVVVGLALLGLLFLYYREGGALLGVSASTPSPTPTLSLTATPTSRLTATPTSRLTVAPTPGAVVPLVTKLATDTPSPTATCTPTATPMPTSTPVPRKEKRTPTATPVPTPTPELPTPTLAPEPPTPTSTSVPRPPTPTFTPPPAITRPPTPTPMPTG